MPRVRGARRRSRGARRSWAVAAVAVSLIIGTGVLVANSYGAPQTQSLQTSAWVRWASGWGRGGYIMAPDPGQRATVNGTAAQLSRQARQRLSVRRETSKQWLASYKRLHTQQYQYYLGHKRLLAQEYQNLLRKWRHGHGGRPSSTATPTSTPAAGSTVTSTATPTATATSAPAATPTASLTETPTANSTATATAMPTATTTTAPTHGHERRRPRPLPRRQQRHPRHGDNPHGDGHAEHNADRRTHCLAQHDNRGRGHSSEQPDLGRLCRDRRGRHVHQRGRELDCAAGGLRRHGDPVQLRGRPRR